MDAFDVTDLPTILQQFTPGAYGVWTGVLMFAGWLLREWRETRKLSAEDRLARREGYAKQVEQLQSENRNLRADLVATEKRHDDYRHACQEENDQLRGEIRGLQDEVTGLKRRLDAQGAAAARAVADGVNAPTTIALIGMGKKA